MSKTRKPAKKAAVRKPRTQKTRKRSTKAANPWAPTRLGEGIIDAAPKYWAAVSSRCSMTDTPNFPGYDADRLADAEDVEGETQERLQEVIEKVIQRPITKLAHLTDLALAFCAWEFDDTISGMNECGPPIATMIGFILDKAGIEIPRPWTENFEPGDEAQPTSVAAAPAPAVAPQQPASKLELESKTESDPVPEVSPIRDLRWPGHQLVGEVGKLTARLAATLEAQRVLDHLTDDEKAKLPPAAGQAATQVDEGYIRRTEALKHMIVELEPCLISDVLTMQLIFLDEFDDFLGKVEARTATRDDIRDIERIARLVTRGLVRQCPEHPLVPHMWSAAGGGSWDEGLETVMGLKRPVLASAAI